MTDKLLDTTRGLRPVHCGDCGWHGKRVIPEGAFQAKPCPNCGSQTVYETPKGNRPGRRIG